VIGIFDFLTDTLVGSLVVDCCLVTIFGSVEYLSLILSDFGLSYHPFIFPQPFCLYCSIILGSFHWSGLFLNHDSEVVLSIFVSSYILLLFLTCLFVLKLLSIDHFLWPGLVFRHDSEVVLSICCSFCLSLRFAYFSDFTTLSWNWLMVVVLTWSLGSVKYLFMVFLCDCLLWYDSFLTISIDSGYWLLFCDSP